MKLLNSTYGKGRVRVMRLSGEGRNREVRELTVLAMMAGDIAQAYKQADNSTTVSTDTIKNVVNVVAREELEAGPEAFCRAVAKRLLNSYRGMTSATVSARKLRWNRGTGGGTPHPHPFALDGTGQGTAEVGTARGRDEGASGSSTRTESSAPRMRRMGRSSGRLADSSNGKSSPDEACRSGALGQFWSRLLSQIAISRDRCCMRSLGYAGPSRSRLPLDHGPQWTR